MAIEPSVESREVVVEREREVEEETGASDCVIEGEGRGSSLHPGVAVP
jgi:hypothetical protein